MPKEIMNKRLVGVLGILRRRVVIVLIILSLISLITAVYLTFYYTNSCQDYGCFQSAMKQCVKATYSNEEPEATWGYQIMGSSGSQCQIQVTLLQVKQGELGIDKLNGQNMLCSYPAGLAVYPEKDLSKCTGRLKEGMQGVIIDKLYKYIISNLGDINKSLNGG